MVRYVVICLVLGWLPFGSVASAAISEDLVFCSKMKNGSERLACYDAAARLEKRPTSSPPPIANAIVPTAARPPRKWDGAFVGIGAAAAGIKSSSQGSLTSNPGGEPDVGVGGDTTTAFGSSAKGSGAGVDLRAGYAAQISSMVFGVQGDLLIPAIRADQSFAIGRCNHPACVHTYNFGDQGSLSANWVGSVTARLGWVTPDNTNLLYALGGISYGDFSSNVVSGLNLATGNANSYQFFFPRVGFAVSGWTAGLGLERRIDEAWSLFGEYRFTRFGSIDQRHLFSYTPCPQGLTCTAVSQMNGSLDFQSVRFGINRSFATAD